MTIRIEGAGENNLQDVSVEIGPGLTVVTGVSGSGKTSLVFDTLYHEARRRFLESFSLPSSTLRLAPARVRAISGLGPAVAVGQNLLNRNPGSTLATASGLHPFLRLFYARFGARRCPRCGSELAVFSQDELVAWLLGLAEKDQVEVFAPLLRGVTGSHRSLLALLGDEFGREDLWVDGDPWDGQPLDAALPHDLELCLARFSPDAGQPAGAASVRSAVQRAAALGASAVLARSPGHPDQVRSRAPVCPGCGDWFSTLEPIHFHTVCPHCGGAGCLQCAHSGLHPAAAGVHWRDLNFRQLLALPVDDALALFGGPDLAESAARLLVEITRRLEALQAVGLGYVALDRPSPTLSRGESQRVRLAVALVSRLEDMLHVLDEPTVGQHPADVARLLPVFRRLAGPVVFVEHDRVAAAAADHAIDIGPGAGRHGGRIVFTGTPEGLWQADTPSGRSFSLRERFTLPAARPAPLEFLTVRGARLRNLRNLDVAIPLERLTVVTGVSGSGKSTLVEDVLAASFEAGRPVGCRAIDGPMLRVVMVDQSPIGLNPRSTPATYTGLADLLRDLFAAETGLSPSHFSFNRPEGACPTCQGMGAVEVKMRYLPSTWIPCADCRGQRFSDEVLAARVAFGERALSIADVFNLPVEEIYPMLAVGDHPAVNHLPEGKRRALRQVLAALNEVGLGYLSLGQPSPTLSGGEAQRVKLTRYLGKGARSGRSGAGLLLVLDEPSTGLHPTDVSGLLAVFNRLVTEGASLLVVEHNLDVIRAADWVIDLGPGAGPQGGRLVYAGPPAGLDVAPDSLTGQALREEMALQPVPASGLPEGGKESEHVIAIRGARANNLRSVSVDFPKGALSVVTGVSGSGKSSLVSDVLEAEARRRFLETLSMYERQGVREGPEAAVETVRGLGVALRIGSERNVYSRRATVGVASELTHHLAVLLSLVGTRDCPNCATALLRSGPAGPGQMWVCPACAFQGPVGEPRHFLPSNYAAACLTCHGVGTMQIPAPHKLIIHPDLPVCAGAMYSPGFFPKGYLGKPFNGGYDMVMALAARHEFDPFTTPWNAMSETARQAFLFGDPEPMQITFRSRTGRTHTREGRFPGFYGFVRDWDTGGTYTDTQPCPECGGSRLRAEFAVVRLGGRTSGELNHLPLVDLLALLERLPSPEPAENSLAAASLEIARRRAHFLARVGLGYLHLDRPSGTLSAGEAQRIRLAGLLGSQLTALTVLLDEPTRGLHPSEVDVLLAALRELCQAGNTVVVVEHEPLFMRAADFLVDMGPGAGANGGQVMASGAPEQVLAADTLTARWLNGARRSQAVHRTRRKPGKRWLVVEGARGNNLSGETVRLPLGLLCGVCGVSGSGKSSLVIDTLGRVLAPRKQTSSVAREPIDPLPYTAIHGAPGRVLLVDQSRAGLHSPASFLGLSGGLIELFAQGEDARALGLDAAQLARRCSACNGSGVQHMDMAFLPAVDIPCETCRGTGFLPEAWDVRLCGRALPEWFGLTLAEIESLLRAEDRAGREIPVGLLDGLAAAAAVGLGYLVFNQPGASLSGGEAQRLKVAAELLPAGGRRKSGAPALYILDEPTVGQHLEDVERLAGVLHRLVEGGASVLVVEHHPHLLAACDWLVELGPGGGPQGGWVVASGAPEALAQGATPIAPYLRAALEDRL